MNWGFSTAANGSGRRTIRFLGAADYREPTVTLSDVGRSRVPEAIVILGVQASDALCISATGVAVNAWTSLELGGWQYGSIIFAGLMLVWTLRALRAYSVSRLCNARGASRDVALSAVLTGVAVLAVSCLALGSYVDHVGGAFWLASAVLLLVAGRILLSRQLVAWDRAGRLRERVAVVGAGPVAQHFLRSIRVGPDPGVEILGVYDDRAPLSCRQCMGYDIVGCIDDLVEDTRRLRIDTVIVALPLSDERRLVATLRKLSLVPVNVRLCPDLFGLRLGVTSVSRVGQHILLNALDRPLPAQQAVLKWLEDRILAAFILSLISPLLIAIALAIKIESRGPVFFHQQRYGLNNRLIRVLKFRTMHHAFADANASQLTRRNDPRITRLGAVLRRYSLDELPQFINVLRGEMSVVGPRPHATAAKAGALLYQEAVKHYDARHRVKPGITGWAQVNGWRGETNTTEQIRKRVEHDLYYIENWSVAFDLKIILRTAFGGFTGGNAF